MTPEQRAAEVQQLRREHPGWSIWYLRRSAHPDGTYYAKPRSAGDPDATVMAATADEIRAAIARQA